MKDEVEFKECRNCKVERHRVFFGKKTLSSDGLQYWCKPCLKIRNKSHYKQSDFFMLKNNISPTPSLKNNNKLDLLIRSVIIYHTYYKK